MEEVRSPIREVTETPALREQLKAFLSTLLFTDSTVHDWTGTYIINSMQRVKESREIAEKYHQEDKLPEYLPNHIIYKFRRPLKDRLINAWRTGVEQDF